MCKTPKIIFITSKQGKKHRLVVPCGKCSDCQNSKRAQFVARCRYELQVTKNCYFVTFTYNDNNLYKLYYKQQYVIYNPQFIKDYLTNNKSNTFAYDKFLLNKEHAKELVINVRNYFKDFYNDKVKYYLTGEYGTVSHRPHFHMLLFTKKKYYLQTLETIFKKLWKLGNVDVAIANDAAINYVAKHQIKDDCGSYIQQKMAPIFALQSRFIGYNMRFDNNILSNYNKGLKFGRVPNTQYKFALPRYIIKYLKPDGYTDDELEEMSQNGYQQLKEKLFGVGWRGNLNDYFSTNKELFDYLKQTKKNDDEMKFEYKKQKFRKKLLILRKNKTKIEGI